MPENDNKVLLGKKVFFLHPSTIVQNQVVTALAQEEFEVYIVKNELKLRDKLRKYSDSVVFACINEGLRENEWEDWIRSVTVNQETAGVSIGIIASGLVESTRRKFILQQKISCGYTVLKSDINDVIKQLITILNNRNCKGRRKYMRALTENEPNTTVNFPMNGTFVNGKLKDISVVGFSCSFEDDPGLVRNSLFGNIQIRLQSQLLKTEGIVFGSRMDEGQKTYVVLFTQRIDPEVRTKIRKYVQSNLQDIMDRELGV